MTHALVTPVVDPSVRDLCRRRYPNHPRGYPNWERRATCPPRARLIGDVLDLSKPVYVVWNRFDFGAHVARMRARHPEWNDRQCACCLYWQGTARKALAGALKLFMWEVVHVEYSGYTLADYGDVDNYGYDVILCPEAHGVNVTATMASVDVTLEWPPVRYAYQVALVGRRAARV